MNQYSLLVEFLATAFCACSYGLVIGRALELAL